jgi:NTP pyrophosphatase (non-canonical NTP hydrolase)
MRVISIGDIVENKVNLTAYRDAAKRTAGACTDQYLLLGLVGESGEVIDVLKKIVRDINNGVPEVEAMASRREKLKDELGDVMWYCAVYHDEVVEDINLVGECEIDIGSAVNSALSMVMSCTEFAMLERPIATLATMETIVYAVCDICNATGININDVMNKNIEKLSARYADGFKLGVK